MKGRELKAYISCNGCEDGRLASAYVERFFRLNGFILTRDLSEADLIVFYACGLTEERENASLAIIKKLKSRIKSSASFIVWGCLPKINPQALSTIYDGPLVGPKDTTFFEKVLEKPTISFDEISANSLVPKETIYTNLIDRLTEYINKYEYRSTFFIQVAAGCTGHCTYCSERCARGRISSRPMERIVSEFSIGLRMGYKHFFLVADDLGPYGVDKGCNLVDLLEKLVRIDGENDYKIIMNQISPLYLKEFLPGLEEVFNSGKIGFVGCPVQSGSDRILNLMGRRYAVNDWKECTQRFSRKFPQIHLGTHLMVGFPTETDEDFNATARILNHIFLDKVGIFKFSTRPCVYASYMPGQIPERIKESRYRRLFLKGKLNTIIKKIQRFLNI